LPRQERTEEDEAERARRAVDHRRRELLEEAEVLGGGVGDRAAYAPVGA
jgi:hypothetical protein